MRRTKNLKIPLIENGQDNWATLYWEAMEKIDELGKKDGNVFTSFDRVKLDSIEMYANNYTHPATHPASIIVTDADNRFVTDIEKGVWSGKLSDALSDDKIYGRKNAAWVEVTGGSGDTTFYATTMVELLSAPTAVSAVTLLGYNSQGDGGGGIFVWDASKNKSLHNGVTIVDPDKVFPSDWGNSSLVNSWYSAGIGLGCWVKNSVDNNSPQMPRTKLVFRGTYDFYVYGDYFIMDGFRFNGTVSKKSELLVKNNIELSGGSGNAGVATLAVANRDYFDILQQNTWFAAFACINDDRPNQTCFYRTVPFLRVHSVSGNKLFLAQYMGRDYTGIGNKANLSWDTSALIGKEILICSETFPGTRTNHPSGRITKITAADNESITVEEAGTISEFDYVLPAPDAKYFHYCGSVYFDTAAIMNFADTGTHVGTRSVNIYTTVPTGAVTTGTTVNCHGHISPLATAIVINNSVGSYLKTPFGFNELFEDGGLHTVAYVGGVVDTFRDTMLTVPFIFGQRFVYKTSGTDAKYRNSHKMLVLGYIEP